MAYKHYSFDLWATLIKANSEFKKQRNLMFYNLYNKDNYALVEINTIVAQEDVKANVLSEKSGYHVPAQQIVANILQRLGNYVNYCMVDKVVLDIQKLFLRYPCTLYDDKTLSTLQMLRHDHTLSILSNTGFILGDTMDIVLNELEISHFFLFKLYSDRIKYSKPHKEAFSLMVCTVWDYRSMDVSKKDILHVGDSVVADGASEIIGVPFYQINSNDKTISNLLR